MLVLLVGGGLFATVGRGSAPDVPTADVTRGEFVDALELRGEIRPLRSVVLSSPMQSGELQILKLANNGSKVKAGDIVVQFDGTTLQRTIQEKQSELKQANAEIEQANAQARIANEQNATALMKSKYDIERAKLDINKGETVSRIENEQAKLSLGDAEQRLKELEVKMRSDKTSAEADLSSKLRKREKAIFDLKRAEDGLEKLQLKAPTDGVVNVLPNYRSGNMMGAAPEFRQGDRAWAGAAILELPDLSSVHLLARLDESDRSRLQGRAGRVRPHRGGAGQRLQGEDRQHLDARPAGLPEHVAAAAQFRSGSRAARRRPADPAGHDGGGAHRHRADSERRAHPVRGDFPARRRDGRLRARRLRVPRAPRPDPEAGQGTGDRRVGDRPWRSHRDQASLARDDQEVRMTRRRYLWPAIGLGVLAVGAAIVFAVPRLPERGNTVPTALVTKGPLKVTVHANGELRAGRTMTLVTPPVGGMLRIVQMKTTGMPVKNGEIVMEFDPGDQVYALEQAKSELAEAEQEIVKMKADADVQKAQDDVAMLTARFDVRRGELDASGNELIPAVEAKKNVLTLEEARRRLAQLEEDVKSRAATNQASLAVVQEKRNKAVLGHAARPAAHRQPDPESADGRYRRDQGKPRRHQLLRPGDGDSRVPRR